MVMRRLRKLKISQFFNVKARVLSPCSRQSPVCVLVSPEEYRSWIVWEMTSRMFLYSGFTWFDSGYMLRQFLEAFWFLR